MSEIAESTAAESVAAFQGLLDAETAPAEPRRRAAPEPASDAAAAAAFEGVLEEEGNQDAGPGDAPDPGGDAEDDDPDADPAIVAPASWSAEAKARFKELPPDLQAVVLERASDQDRTFHQRMTDAAEQRKAAEAERTAAATERAEYARSLATVRQLLEQQAPAAAIDWDKLAAEDPGEYIRMVQAETKRQSQLQAVQAEQQKLRDKHQAEMQAANARAVAEQAEKLLAAVPEWRDPKKAAAEKTALRAFLVEAGYSEDELALAADHRAIVLARKAMAYDRLMAGRPQVQKRVAEVPAVQRPGSGPRQSRGDERVQADLNRLKSSGSVKDAARIFERMI